MTMKKTPFSNYKPITNGVRSIDEAISEVQREMDVRKRLFDRWVTEGRMSWVDAHDRLERQMSALKWLIIFAQQIDREQAAINNPDAAATPEHPTDPSSPVPYESGISLDERAQYEPA